MNLVAFWLGSAACALSVAGLAVDRFRSRRALPFEPPACYVCDHLGPTGVLVPKLPCCLACRVAINAEVERALNPWAEDPEVQAVEATQEATRFYALWLANRGQVINWNEAKQEATKLLAGVPLEQLQNQRGRLQ